MKLKKQIAAFVAATTLFAPYDLYGPTSEVASDVYAEDTGVVAELPEWIPGDLESALTFANTYGATHTGNGLICVVRSFRRTASQSEDTYGYGLDYPKDMGQLLRNQIIVNDDTGICFQVFVFQPLGQGDISLKLLDINAQVPPDSSEAAPVVAEYTFTSGEGISVDETDIYSWLPDCVTEFNDFKKQNGNVSVKDNYVVFCRSSNAGTPFRWEESDTPEEFECAAASGCSRYTSVPLDGGAVLEAIAYRAVKDGHAKLEHKLAPVIPDVEVSEVLTADCMITDNAQNILLPEDTRISLLEYSTGEPVAVSRDNPFTLVEIVNSPGPAPVVAKLTSNPYILRDRQVHGLGVALDMPEGYRTPEIEGTALTREDYITFTAYENGAESLVIKPEKITSDIPEGKVRITLMDADTGLPIEVTEESGFTLIAGIAPYEADRQGIKIKSNPCLINGRFTEYVGSVVQDTSLIVPEGYSLPLARDGQTIDAGCKKVTKYDNGTYDIVFRLSKTDNTLPAGAARATFLDRDTGEPIPEYLLEHHPCVFSTEFIIDDPAYSGTSMMCGNRYILETNPQTFEDELAEYCRTARSYQFYEEYDPEITYYSNGSVDLVFRTKTRVTGNINGDSNFSIADAVTLQNWLLGKTDTELKNWEQADFTLDCQLDTFDLCIMLNKLAEREENAPVAVDFVVTGGVAGVHYEYKIYAENGKYYISYDRSRSYDGDPTGIVEITQEQYHDIMTFDYKGREDARKIRRDEHIVDGFNHHTTLTYADGSQYKISADMSPVEVMIYNYGKVK